MADDAEEQLELRRDTSPSPAAEEPIVVDPATDRRLGTVSAYYQATYHSGPLPSASELAEYNRVVPGLAEQITTEWRTETQHRRRMEQTGLTAAVRAHRRGQYIGLLLVLFVSALGAWLTYEGKSTVGVAAMIAPLAGIAGVFVYNQVRERERPDDE